MTLRQTEVTEDKVPVKLVLCLYIICERVSALFIAQDIVGNVSRLKVEGNARASIAKRTLVSLNLVVGREFRSKVKF